MHVNGQDFLRRWVGRPRSGCWLSFSRRASGVLVVLWVSALAAADRSPDHWAFQPVHRPSVPPVERVGWARTPLDRFVLSKLEEARLEPSPEATRFVLIRRLFLDLVGLTPTPEQVDAFVKDPRPDAYEQQIEVLLASPHYGERWGRHWLDVARYADSGGYEADPPRTVWRYRDYVINAFNQDLPFDRFVVEQLAGDLLPGSTVEQKIATAFHANSMLDGNLPWEANIDRLSTTATVFLGLTFGCAQCHDHKTDPVSNREFYEFYTFFNEAANDELSIASASDRARHEAVQPRIDRAQKELDDYQKLQEAAAGSWEARLTSEQRNKLPALVQQALGVAAAKRSAGELNRILEAFKAQDPRYRELTLTLEALKACQPRLPVIPVLSHRTNESRMFIRGNPEQPGAPVAPGLPAALRPQIATASQRLTRLDLATWLTSPINPLTARVTVNRVWQHYFGQGLVETENDFGLQTPAPMHQPALDWLAAEFISRGWSWKHLHRLILRSSTYRQSSVRRPELELRDPRNTFLARQQRFRLEAETIRDAALAVSGLLQHRIGGPSVFPFQPDGVLDFRATKAEWVQSEGADRYRRGMYIWFWRLTPYPYLTLLDAPDAFTTNTRRARSNTPTQALTLLNDPVFFEAAQALAARILEANAASTSARLAYAMKLCLGRKPTLGESEALGELLHQQLEEFEANPEEAARVVGLGASRESVVERAAWTVLARSLLNLDEFLSRE